jgi:hypothetical protein
LPRVAVPPAFLDPILKAPSVSWALHNVRSKRLVATRIETAFDSPTRRRGLLGRDSLGEGAALILAPCNSIHTFFMRFAIDVAFVARDGAVIATCTALPARRLRISLRAFAVVELAAGALVLADTRIGDALRLVDNSPRRSD